MKRVGWKILLGGSAALITALVADSVSFLQAQPPRGDRGGSQGVESSVNRLMAYDADQDGKLSKTEITDSRLLPLLKRCDANDDGVVSREELTAQLTREVAATPANSGGPGGDNGGPGGPPRAGSDPRGPMPPGPGQILPPFVVDELRLTEVQREQLQDLQRDVDAKLAKILTPGQLEQLRQSRGRGPRGPGGEPRGGSPPRPR